MKRCPNCDNTVENDEQLCPSCGAPINHNRMPVVVMAIGLVLIIIISIGSASFLFINTSKVRIDSEAVEVITAVEEKVAESVSVEGQAASGNEWIEAGIEEYENGNYDEAIKQLLEALNYELDDTELFDIYYYLADSYYYIEAYDDAIINYHKALEYQFDYLTTVYLAQTYFLTDDLDRADEYFEEAFKMDDESPEAYLFYAEYLYFTGDLDGAEKNALIADEKNPDDFHAKELLVYIHFDKGEIEESDRYYDALVDMDYPYMERVTTYINETKE